MVDIIVITYRANYFKICCFLELSISYLLDKPKISYELQLVFLSKKLNLRNLAQSNIFLYSWAKLKYTLEFNLELSTTYFDLFSKITHLLIIMWERNRS